MGNYMLRTYDSFNNEYLPYCEFYSSEQEAIEQAIEWTQDFVDNEYNHLEADVFVETLGMSDYQLIGYVSYDAEELNYDSIEFVECFN